MRTASFLLGTCTIALAAQGMGQQTGGRQAVTMVSPTPLIVPEDAGERREFRTRPGTFFTVKVDPKNGGSNQLVVIAEDMAPGDRIPKHRHPDADELIIIHTGTARVTLGDEVREAHAGGIVFVPKGTWIGVENVGTEHLISTGVLSATGYEEYLRAISVPAGMPITPLSRAELDEIRKKYAQHAIYQ
jgi:quercetin dioxygenase-like cupin family protein